MSLRNTTARAATMAKSVCIIGAGPSGLVAAKNLLHNAPAGNFKVSVYEAQDDIGGLWPTSKLQKGRQIHPLMVANQSKHTMHFSDLAWPEDAPQLPQAWMVGQYLQRYSKRYLESSPDYQLHLSTKVKAAEKTATGWDITTDGADKTSFDYLLVATGYFGQPIVPDSLKAKATIPVIHSCQYRDIQQLLKSANSSGRKILVVGGQMSGVEIAATIASHLSSATHSPTASGIADIADYKVHHVIQRPIWVFPLHTTPEPSSAAPPFVPLDLSSYNRNARPRPLTNSQGHITVDAAKRLHGIFEKSLGSDQASFSEQLKIDDKGRSEPAYLAVSDWHCDFVRSGAIQLSTGRVESIESNTATLSDGSTIDDIAAVVVAAGFDASPCLDFLPKDVLATIQHSPSHNSQIAALAFHATHHPEVSNLGFVGFYRSPYWGVMQMQARFLSQLWSGNQSESLKQKLQQDDSIARTISLRDDPRLSQFPMGDYAFLMQEFAEALSIDFSAPIPTQAPNLSSNNLPLHPLTPSCYAVANEDGENNKQAQLSMADAAKVAEEALTSPRFVSRAVFRSLLGTWNLERDLTSKLPSHPSGHFSGTAQFLVRQQTPDGLQCATSTSDITPSGHETAWEYLYIEDGTFSTEQGFGFRATRRYIYRYDEASDKLSVWFAHPEDQKKADYLFHEVEFTEPDARLGWSAKSGHLCIDDYYDVKYRFKFNSVNLARWCCEYTVNGPKKDYTIRGVYTR
ncbi:hypothetical protein VHEMI09399 [[Torrubiella] hemipterigena]|uniref:DUF6314 domain-containing protein n=1 Tax=[Torrubiella] hemipterigena TaxID=1531966 RepID=A0A0A1TRF5_9HYPO|nr:hypothetical protein VHEMI09399 [[Torrubiella] hemipterigena]